MPNASFRSSGWRIVFVDAAAIGFSINAAAESTETTLGRPLSGHGPSLSVPEESFPSGRFTLRDRPSTVPGFLSSTRYRFSMDDWGSFALNNNQYLNVVGLPPALWKTRIDEASSIDELASLTAVRLGNAMEIGNHVDFSAAIPEIAEDACLSGILFSERLDIGPRQINPFLTKLQDE